MHSGLAKWGWSVAWEWGVAECIAIVEAEPPTGGEAYTVHLRLSEKASNGSTATIYDVFYANYTLYIAS
jgi:hypothetical protein